MQSIRPRLGRPSDELGEHIPLNPNAELAVGEARCASCTTSSASDTLAPLLLRPDL